MNVFLKSRVYFSITFCKIFNLLITIYSYVIYTSKVKVQCPVFVGVLITGQMLIEKYKFETN